MLLYKIMLLLLKSTLCIRDTDILWWDLRLGNPRRIRIKTRFYKERKTKKWHLWRKTSFSQFSRPTAVITYKQKTKAREQKQCAWIQNMRCLIRNIKINNVWFKESLLTTKEVEVRHDDRPVTMGAGERSGSRQWPLCLWGFSWPGVSPGTWEPESSSQSHYTDITHCPEQSAVVGAGEWMTLVVSGDGVLGGSVLAARNSVICPAL